ncbi:MAG: hypothetical protein ACK5M3_05635 [Dysgonomonas sp.]
MKDELYINGKDAWLTWGVYLEDGSEEKLLLPPPNKEYIENKSRSQPGKQIILRNPQPDERDVQVVFCISARDRKDYMRKYRLFVNALKNGLIAFKVTSIYTVFQFTTTSFTNLSFFNRLGKLSVKFNEPNPSNRQSTLLTAYLLSTKGKTLISKSNKLLTKNIE